MEYKVNYKIMHVHELEAALESINQESFPDEAAYIRELIEKGGYKPPTHSIIKSADISNKYFKWIFLFLLTASAAGNLIFFLQTYIIPLLFAVSINAIIIFLILSKSAHMRTGIKIWGAFAIIGGSTGILRLLLITDPWPLTALIQPCFTFALGVLVIWLANKYVVFNERSSNN